MIHFPTATHSESVRKSDRHVTLDRPLWPSSTKKSASKTSTKADNPAVWLQALVSSIAGRDLRDLLGFWAEGLPRIVGLDQVSENNFDSFLSGFQAGLGALGLTEDAPRQRMAKRHGSAVGGDDLPPLPSGLRVKRRTRMDAHRAVTRFDQFEAQLAEAASFQQAVDNGTRADGLVPGATDLMAALVGALRSAMLANDLARVQVVAQDFAAALVAVAEATQVPSAQRASEPGFTSRRLKKIGPARWAAPGHQVVRRGAGSAITKIESLDGEVLWQADADQERQALERLTGRR